ncbi:response regulator [Sabulicella rubraurantiaca]|uniref:hypothetical protein n=1 Tax=Sabulicella rubraurantiaca TaxID=2811429 RepID=UPI001A964FE0|nr:hypothetical protein [Sabulicella rubraurantiaca]
MKPNREVASPKVLVVEDDYFQASALARALEEAGVQVAGPVGTLDAAMRMLQREADITAAVLDVEPHGEPVFPAAAELTRKGIPLIFTGTRPRSGVPLSLRAMPWLATPVAPDQVLGALQLDRPLLAGAEQDVAGTLAA